MWIQGRWVQVFKNGRSKMCGGQSLIRPKFNSGVAWTLSWRRSLSYGGRSIDCGSMGLGAGPLAVFCYLVDFSQFCCLTQSLSPLRLLVARIWTLSFINHDDHVYQRFSMKSCTDDFLKTYCFLVGRNVPH